MPATVKVKILVPELWTKQDSLRTGLDTLALIKARTMRGVSSTGARFKEYSSRPIYISKNAFPTPKGGRLSRTGDTVYYANGYREYKKRSRRFGSGGARATAEVDLTLTGNLMNGLQVIKHSKKSFTIGLIEPVRHYGYEVHDARPFIGLTYKESQMITEVIQRTMGRRIKGK